MVERSNGTMPARLTPDQYRAACDAVAAGIGSLTSCHDMEVSTRRRPLRTSLDALRAVRLTRRDDALTERALDLIRRGERAMADSFERMTRKAA